MPRPLSGTIKRVAFDVTGTAVKLTAYDGSRLEVLVQNTGTVDVRISEANTVSASGATEGFLLKGGQTPPDYYYTDKMDGSLWAVGVGGTARVVVCETVRR